MVINSSFLCLKDKENVMFGLKMNGSELKGRKIRVYKARSQDEVSTGDSLVDLISFV